MLDDPDLLRNDVQLFADFDADLDQRRAVVGADPFRFRQFVPDDLAGQVGVERLATALPAGARTSASLKNRSF